MSLRDKVLSKQAKTQTVVVDGDTVLVRSLPHLDRAKCFTDGRDKKGDMAPGRSEANFLAACVCDPETSSPIMDWKEWSTAQDYITGPLLSVIRDVNGLDAEDLGKKPDDTSDTTS
jgi:hypothetical protein